MSDAPDQKEQKNLPPPAVKVGGVRQVVNRPAKEETAVQASDSSSDAAANQEELARALGLSGPATGQPTSQEVEKNPKMMPSTYNPPQQPHMDNFKKQKSNASGLAKGNMPHIQPGGSQGHAGSAKYH